MLSRRRFLAATGGLAAFAALPKDGRALAAESPELEAAVAAAKGQTLNMIVDPADAYREVIGIFSRKFPEISVQASVMHPSDAAPRVISEQKNGVYAWDAWWGTCTNMNSVATPAGILAPITDSLLLPEVSDVSNWRRPDMLYTSDKGDFVFVHTLSLINQGAYDADQVPGGDLSLDELLDPSLKGRISIRIPNRPHGGSLMLAQIAHEKGFDFVEKLLTTMDPVYVDNDRQNTMSVMRGDSAVGIGTAEDTLYECHKGGGCANVKPFPTADMQARGVSVFKNRPNQAAATVWVNWLLSREGQEAYVAEWAKGSPNGAVSMRKDVAPAPGHAESLPDTDHIDRYAPVSYDRGREEVQAIIQLYKKVAG
ncbi:ABC transporter substrate-binding protein [Propylenella binzhouense]|nr:substrate-binding domain-containing protein [Propylenella binzhouense]